MRLQEGRHVTPEKRRHPDPLGDTTRYAIKRIWSKSDDIGIAAVVSTEKLNITAGKYVGKDDPYAYAGARAAYLPSARCSSHTCSRPSWQAGCAAPTMVDGILVRSRSPIPCSSTVRPAS